MKILRFALLFVVLFSFAVSGVAYAGEGVQDPFGPDSPNTITSFSFNPSTVYYGDTTTISVDYDTAGSGTSYDNVFCFYFDDGGWNSTSVWPTSGDGSRSGSGTYTRYTVGTSGGECDAPSTYGRTYVAEYVYNDVSFAVKLFGETATFNLTVPGSSPPAAGVHTFDLVQEEGGSDCGDPGGTACNVTDGASADLTLANPPNTVYVSNDSTCGGNSPCYTGPNALQNAFDVVVSGGTVNIYGTWSQGGGNTATLNNNKSVTLTGFNTPRIENGGGTCSGAMIENAGSGTLTVQNLTIDGTCGSGTRSAGILNSGSGTTEVTDNANTIRDFTGTGNAGVEVSNGTMIVAGNAFANNDRAMEQSGGTLYAFANNVTDTSGADAAVHSSGSYYNLKCNYWGGATIDSTYSSDYAERLGSPVVSYVEGSGSLTLGNATLAAGTGNQVLINLGRDKNTPPFGNGTVDGLGALVSDFYAACSSRDGSAVGAITISGDNVNPDPDDGFRLYEITDATQCSPADNTDCWDYAGAVDGNGDPTGTGASGDDAICTSGAGCSVVDETASEGHFVVGNAEDPTLITLESLSVSSGDNMWLPFALLAGSVALVVGAAAFLRKRQQA